MQEIKRIIKAFGYSLEGIKAAFEEAAFRTEALVCIIAFPSAFFLGKNKIEIAIMIACLFLVLIVELLNTGIEDAINRVSLEKHPLSKRAKDVASAAVLLSIINAFAVWAVILWN